MKIPSPFDEPSKDDSIKEIRTLNEIFIKPNNMFYISLRYKDQGTKVFLIAQDKITIRTDEGSNDCYLEIAGFHASISITSNQFNEINFMFRNEMSTEDYELKEIARRGRKNERY